MSLTASSLISSMLLMAASRSGCRDTRGRKERPAVCVKVLIGLFLQAASVRMRSRPCCQV